MSRGDMWSAWVLRLASFLSCQVVLDEAQL